jgi:hypothetical protein
MNNARVATLVFTLLAGFVIEGQQPKLDHFKFWKVKTIEAPNTVSLLGQFDGKKAWRAALGTINYLGNPVDKNKEGIVNPKLHLVAYSIRAETQPARMVWFTNQFAKVPAKWQLGQPAWLLVPAAKSLSRNQKPGAPPVATHFVCYTVDGQQAFSRSVTLLDQFDKLSERIEKIEQLTPAYFCVPVQKRFKEKVEKILHPDTHLAIYKISPQVTPKNPIEAFTNDQFGARDQIVLGPEFLAVPSIKQKWTPLR